MTTSVRKLGWAGGRACLALSVLAGTTMNAWAQARRDAGPARVALILDQRSARFQPLIDAFRREIQSFFQPGEIELLPDRAGDGTIAGLEAEIQRAFRDPSVSVVVTMGSIGSHLVARSGPPPKPAIAAMVVDAAWQSLPQRDGMSGVPRLTYVDQSYPVAETVAEFHRLIPFRKLAVLMDRDLLRAIPTMSASISALVRAAGSEGEVVPSGASATDILAALPAGADAVYLTPVPALTDAQYQLLIDGLTARKLPTLSYLADPDVRMGALASYEPPENWRRRARRVAVDLQRIVAGEDAARLPVRLVSSPRLTLNLETARRIGFHPGPLVRTEAELIGTDSIGPADSLGLADAMQRAVSANLELAAANLEVASGRQDVTLARASLLPQVSSGITETLTRSETAEASLGRQPQRKLDGSLSFSMPLYSEQAWASYGVERRLQEGRTAERDQRRLDVALDAGTAYLDVLRARTQAEVQRSNLFRARANLEVARLREGVGSASRADVYRWQGEVANGRRSVIAAEAQIRVAELELARLLNLPMDKPVAHRAVALGEPRLLALDSAALAVFDDPARVTALTRFLVGEGMDLSPELDRVEATIGAQQRQRTAARRSFWLPSLSLEGGLSNELDRGGAGTVGQPIPGVASGAEDYTWQVRVQASLPLFTGMSREAGRTQAGIDLDRLGIERDGLRQRVEQRVRAALETAASSWAAIRLTRDAAEAADRNYDLVTDAYAGGTAGITTLLDAQSAARNAAESAANAVHDFLLDLLRVERSIGRFGALQPADAHGDFQARLETALRSGEN